MQDNIEISGGVIYDHINKEVLKSFKNLQKEKSYLYTSAVNEYLTCINDKSMIVYDNPDEIDFEGTFRLTRNKLIAVDDCVLASCPEKSIDLHNFKFLGAFGKNISDLQKFCYDHSIRINMAYITPTVDQLLAIYKNYKLYLHTSESQVMFVFSNKEHKTYLLNKLI